MSERLLLLGGTGLLGRALAQRLRATGRRFEAPGRARLDLAALRDTAAAESSLAFLRPSAVLNAASFSDVAAAERPEAAPMVYLLNRDLPGRLAQACRRLGVPFVHLSTDYVFDGRAAKPYLEEDRPAPLQVYGRSKREGEIAALSAHPGALVARTSTLFGPGERARPHYVEAILRQARQRRPIEVVETPIASPTYAPDLAAALLALLDRGASGLLHVVNAGSCSRLELARAAVAAAGLAGEAPVHPRPADASGPARPAFSALDTTRFAALAGGPLRLWREALTEYLAIRGEMAPGKGA